MLGLDFSVEPSDFDESVQGEEKPRDLVARLSEGKARSVAQKHADAVVIGADTFVVLDDDFLFKPADEADAIKMVTRLSGRCHDSIAAFTIIDTKLDKTITRSVVTKVCFRKLTDVEIKNYVTTGEPMEKAGAYAIQGRAAAFISRVDGEPYAMMGFPLSLLAETLAEFDITL